MREGEKSFPLAFQYLILMIWRPCDLNFVTGFKMYYLNVINGKHWQGTHSTKMGADRLFENMYPQMPQNLSAQIVCPSPYFGISMKKGFIGRP